MTKRTKRNYINNADFLIALDAYKEKCADAENSGEERPIVSNYIGECFYHIANRLATKSNFSGYTFRDDMVQDGIENCLQYMHNFDSKRTQNPFAYFTQVIWNAFLRRIAKEKKQMYIRYKSSHEMLSSGGTYDGGDDIEVHLNVSGDYINDFIETYENKMKAAKNKKNIVKDIDEEVRDDTDND